MTPELGYVLRAQRDNPNPTGVIVFQKRLTTYISLKHGDVENMEKCVDLAKPEMPTIPEIPDPVLKTLADFPDPPATRAATSELSEAEKLERLEKRKEQRDQNNRVEVKKWEDKTKRREDRLEALNKTKTKVFAVIYGNMGNDSIDLVKQTSAGAKAISDKDPVGLWKAILSTHLLRNTRSDESNFFDANCKFNNMSQQKPHESLLDLSERIDVIVAALTEAAKRASKEAMVPDEKYITQLMVERLMDQRKWGAFIQHWKRAEASDAAKKDRKGMIDAATLYGEGPAPNQIAQQLTSLSAVATKSAQRGGGGRHNEAGRGRNSGRGRGRGVGIALHGACSRCHKQGHTARECSDREVCPGCEIERCKETLQERRDINRAYLEQRAQGN